MGYLTDCRHCQRKEWPLYLRCCYVGEVTYNLLSLEIIRRRKTLETFANVSPQSAASGDCGSSQLCTEGDCTWPGRNLLYTGQTKEGAAALIGSFPAPGGNCLW